MKGSGEELFLLILRIVVQAGYFVYLQMPHSDIARIIGSACWGIMLFLDNSLQGFPAKVRAKTEETNIGDAPRDSNSKNKQF